MKKIYHISRGVSLALALLLLMSSVSVAQAPAAEMKLPEGTVKISDAIPAMGEHWANPKDLPLGPIYLVWQGKVIGVEYMFTLAMLNVVPAGPPSPTGEVSYNYETPNLPLFGQKIDHLTISYMPDGHQGFTVPHYDVHFYFISPADRYKIVLNIPPPPAVSKAPAASKTASSIQTSAIIPRMGSHWSEPGNLPFGPIYLADKAGKEVGIEFMYNHDKMRSHREQEGPGGPTIWMCDIDYVPVGRSFEHAQVTYLPKGHEGYTTWHFDIHLYTITPEERAAILL